MRTDIIFPGSSESACSNSGGVTFCIVCQRMVLKRSVQNPQFNTLKNCFIAHGVSPLMQQNNQFISYKVVMEE